MSNKLNNVEHFSINADDLPRARSFTRARLAGASHPGGHLISI